MKRQPLSISIKELRDLADDLDKQRLQQNKAFECYMPTRKRWQVNIIQRNKFSNWELELYKRNEPKRRESGW